MEKDRAHISLAADTQAMAGQEQDLPQCLCQNKSAHASFLDRVYPTLLKCRDVTDIRNLRDSALFPSVLRGSQKQGLQF